MNTEQERTEFEAWYRLHHGSRDVYGRDASGEYVDKQVQGAFNVWQARAALTAQPAAATRVMADRQITHAPGCWSWGPRHYECAVGQIERDEALLRQALEGIELHLRHHECGCVFLDEIVLALRERLSKGA